MLAKLQLYKSVVVLLLKYASPVYMEPTYQEGYSKAQECAEACAQGNTGRYCLRTRKLQIQFCRTVLSFLSL